MMKQKITTISVAAMIALVTALGVWAGLPIGDETAEQMRKAATSYEEYVKITGRTSNNLAKYVRNYRTNPSTEDALEIKFAPDETAAALAAAEETVKAMRRRDRALKALAIKFRHLAPEN